MTEIPQRQASLVVPLGELARDWATGQMYRGDGVTAGGNLITDEAGSPSTVADPEFSPPGSAGFDGEITITLTSETAGASFRYTRNSGAPTEREGILYRGPFTITGTELIQAIAYKPGMVSSSVVSATFLKGEPGSVTSGIYPMLLEVFEGQDAVFHALASGSPTYLWQSSDDDGDTWATASGTSDASSYTIEDTVRATHDGMLYRCLINGIPTDAATLEVWSPAALAPYIWLSPDSAMYEERDGSGTTPSTNSGPVGDWRDMSGNDRHVRAPSDAARPTLLTDTLNNRSVLSFTTDDVLRHATASDWTFLHNGTEYLVASVWKPGSATDPNALYALMGTRSSGAGTVGMYIGHDTRDGTGDRRIAVSEYNGSAAAVSQFGSPGSAPANAHHVLLVHSNSASDVIPNRTRVWLNGGVVEAHNTGTGTPSETVAPNALQVGASITGGTHVNEYFLTGEIAEFIIISGAVATEDRLKLRDWLAYRYGIAMTARAEVGLFSDAEMYRNKSDTLTVAHNSPTLHPNSPVYTSGALSPGGDIYYPSVVWTGTELELYHIAYVDANTPYLCKVTSPDGVTWTEPNLGILTIGGNTNNNALVADLTAFFVAPEQVSGKWVASVDKIGAGDPEVFIYESADGTTWSQVKDNSSIPGEYAEARVMFQLENGYWLQSYTRGHKLTPQDRELGFLTTPGADYTGTWSDLGPTVLTSGATDQKYAWGFEQHGRGWLVCMGAYDSDSALTDGDLYWMSDTGHFTKLVDAAFPLGVSGTWNDGIVNPTSIITRGNSTLIYGHAGAEPHDVFPRNSGVALWTIGKRRWSQIAGTGEFETPAFRANDDALTVNCDASAGSVTVEVVDNATGLIMTGYDRTTSTEITSDTYDGAVTWGASALPTDREVRLRFILDNATLYSWTAGTE